LVIVAEASAAEDELVVAVGTLAAADLAVVQGRGIVVAALLEEEGSVPSEGVQLPV
jgi:hypothetical protein